LVAEEAEKGYGLRVIRSDKTTGPRRACDPILKDIVTLGKTYDTNAHTAVRSEKTSDDAIPKEAARRQHNLIVMGVERSPGKKLFLGETATAILEKSNCSIVFVVS
jgi:nucleotide-binding universal stress UspA family protein